MSTKYRFHKPEAAYFISFAPAITPPSDSTVYKYVRDGKVLYYFKGLKFNSNDGDTIIVPSYGGGSGL